MYVHAELKKTAVTIISLVQKEQHYTFLKYYAVQVRGGIEIKLNLLTNININNRDDPAKTSITVKKTISPVSDRYLKFENIRKKNAVKHFENISLKNYIR